ncbi:hypothetical protein E3N88_38828 [Mikania micrantha]|uniref:Uncharacterized protein n=1 Tax=Mikania micrantha TaxID=192012 RepID=A0A5N6LV71_9ASTR|nr:hypothetical protein E3N88_38828 [Mikania micrantha]
MSADKLRAMSSFPLSSVVAPLVDGLAPAATRFLNQAGWKLGMMVLLIRDSADTVVVLLKRFGGLAIHNPSEQLATTQQSDSIQDSLYDLVTSKDVEDTSDFGGLVDSVSGNISLSCLHYASGSKAVFNQGLLGVGQPQPNNEENDIGESEHLLLEAANYSDPIDPPVTGTCWAIGSVGLLANMGVVTTLSFEGVLQGIPVCLMVDSGAIPNFVSQHSFIALGLSVGSFDSIRIKLGKGQVE